MFHVLKTALYLNFLVIHLEVTATALFGCYTEGKRPNNELWIIIMTTPMHQ